MKTTRHHWRGVGVFILLRHLPDILSPRCLAAMQTTGAIVCAIRKKAALVDIIKSCDQRTKKGHLFGSGVLRLFDYPLPVGNQMDAPSTYNIDGGDTSYEAKTIKLFFPLIAISFNELCVWSLLVEGSRYKRAVRNLDIRKRLGLHYQCIRNCLQSLVKMNLAAEYKDGWTAVKPLDETFREKYLSDQECAMSRRGRKTHWSQHLQFLFVSLMPHLTNAESAVWALAHSFVSRSRRYKRNTFHTMLRLSWHTIDDALDRLEELNLIVDDKDCLRVKRPPTAKRKQFKGQFKPAETVVNEIDKQARQIQIFNDWIETIEWRDIAKIGMNMKKIPADVKHWLRVKCHSEGLQAAIKAYEEALLKCY